MKRKQWLAFLLSAFFLYLFLFAPNLSAWRSGDCSLLAALFHSRINWAEVGRILANARLLPLALAVLITALNMLVRGWRWQCITRPLAPVSVMLMYHLTNIGYLANNILPMRLGEVARAGLLARSAGVGFSPAFATVVLERLLDFLGTLGVLLLALLWMPVLDTDGKLLQQLVALAPWLSLLAGLLFAVLLAMVVWREPVIRLLERLLAFLPERMAQPLLRIVEGFADGLSILRSPSQAVLLLVQSALVQIGYLAALGFMLAAVGVTTANTAALGCNLYGSLLFILTLLTFGYAIPAAPGAIGTVQYFSALAVGMLGVPSSAAQGFALTNHLVTWVVLSALGLYSLIRLGLRPVDLMQHKES